MHVVAAFLVRLLSTALEDAEEVAQFVLDTIFWCQSTSDLLQKKLSIAFAHSMYGDASCGFRHTDFAAGPGKGLLAVAPYVSDRGGTIWKALREER